MSLLASAWNVPIISWDCMLEEFSNKHIHPTFSRVTKPASDKVKIVKELVITFGWTRVGIISDTYNVYKEQSKKLFSELRLINVTAFYYYTVSFANHRNGNRTLIDLKNAVKSIKNRVRVLIIYTSWLPLEKLLLLLRKGNMEEGYVFILNSDHTLVAEHAKDFQNWLIIRTSTPDLNEQVLDADFNDPLFRGMMSNPDKGVISSYAGKYIPYLEE